MDTEKFFSILPQLYQNIYPNSITPKKAEFLKIKQQLNSPISTNTMELLNAAVSCLELGEVYCQAGSKSEATLIGALLDNEEAMAYAIAPEDSEDLSDCLLKFNLDEQVCIAEQDVITFFQELEDLNLEEKIGVYYDNHSKNYRDLFKGLISVKPYISDQALIIIANFNHTEIEEAVVDFINLHPNKQVHQLLNSKQSVDIDFDEGLTILLWQPDPQKARETKITNQGLAKLAELNAQEKKILLHVGCGSWRPNALPSIFEQEPWVELRLDIDPNVKPDLVSSITDLSILPDNCVDAVYSSHNLEHVYNFEVPIALSEFKRVLKPNGFVYLKVPDLQIAAEYVARGDLEDVPVYNSPGGEVPAIWMFYGLGTTQPGIPYMAHKTGFTAKTMADKLTQSGFNQVEVVRKNFNIIGYGYK